MPRRYLNPIEARELRIMGQGEQIQRDENDEDFIVYTSSEGSCSDGYEDLAGDHDTATDLLLHAHVHEMTENERVDAILNGDMMGLDLENLTERETQAVQIFIDELAMRTGIARPRLPLQRQVNFCMPQPEPQPEVACALQPQPNLLQVQPEEVDQGLLELAFADAPEVDINTVIQLLGAPGDPGDPNNGSVVVNDCDDEPDMRHFTVRGGGRKKSRRKNRRKKTKSKRKSKRKTRKRKSIR